MRLRDVTDRNVCQSFSVFDTHLERNNTSWSWELEWIMLIHIYKEGGKCHNTNTQSQKVPSYGTLSPVGILQHTQDPRFPRVKTVFYLSQVSDIINSDSDMTQTN